MKRVLEERHDEGLPASLIDYVCFKYRKLSLSELKGFLGIEKFLDFINLFAGSYLQIPASKKLMKLYYKYLAAVTVLRMKQARAKRDLMDWNRQEAILFKIAKRTKHKYKYIYNQGMSVLKELERVGKWSKEMKIWERKHLGK